MAVVFPDKRLIAVPMPRKEDYEVLDKVFVTRILPREKGRDILVLPHHEDCLNILKNIGVNVEGCDLFDWYYTPPTTKDGKSPWWWQMETAKFLTRNKRAFVTSTPRTGKTLSTLMAIDFVQKHLGAKAALIVAPLTVANKGEWHRTCSEWFPDKRVVLIHNKRQDEVNKDADIYLINPDGLKIMTDELAKKVSMGEIGIVVFDELTEFANPRSKRWRAANAVASLCPFRWGLTGTPGGPEKIYGQVKLINPENVPPYFSRWRDMTEVKISQFKWAPSKDSDAIVKKALSPCIRFDKEQIMQIPVPRVVREEAPLSAEQARVTKQIAESLVAMVDNDQIEATTAGAIAVKLLQVSGGVVRSTDGDPIFLDASPKLAKLDEILRRTPRKKVVFTSFTAVNEMLVEHIRESGMSCERIDGSVTGNKRAEILRAFMDDEDPHVLVCHPRTTAYGIELARADCIVCYGPPITGPFMYQQMFERLSSARQEAKETFVVHLSAGLQDRISFSALSRGVNIERGIVKLFTANIDEFRY